VTNTAFASDDKPSGRAPRAAAVKDAAAKAAAPAEPARSVLISEPTTRTDGSSAYCS
jgi:hypothetical protein